MKDALRASAVAAADCAVIVKDAASQTQRLDQPSEEPAEFVSGDGRPHVGLAQSHAMLFRQVNGPFGNGSV
jgi:hypothetical protein